MNEWSEFKKQNWDAENVVCQTYEWGTIHFSRKAFEEVVGRGKMTYDAYLDLMKDSAGKCRKGFELCYYGGGKFGVFKGEIEKINRSKICFKRIYITGMYADGLCFNEKEDHVWMDRKGFEAYRIEDCVSFCAEIYRYIKTGHGKILDYALRNPEGIEKIEKYDLPTDDELVKQTIAALVCDTCPMMEYCGESCFNVQWRDRRRQEFYQVLKKKRGR